MDPEPTATADTGLSEERAAMRVFQIVDAQLAEERATKASLESRAFEVIKTNGTVVGLLLGVGALVTGADGFSLNWWEVILPGLALVAFVASVTSALSVAKPVEYEEMDVQGLSRLIDKGLLAAPLTEAGNDLTKRLLRMIAKAREGSEAKAERLGSAIKAQAVAIALLASGVLVILITAVATSH